MRYIGRILPTVAVCALSTMAYAQSTSTLSGIVADPTGAVIPNASVTITNEATKDTRVLTTNNAGIFSAPALTPSTYTVTVTAAGFAGRSVTGVELHAGDTVSLPAIALVVGGASDVITVQTSTQLLTTENGQRSEVLSYKDIQDLALQGRDTTELLKILPGVTNVTTGNNPTYNALNVTAGQSAIGQGLNSNGAPNRGGTTILIDGVNTIDPGADFSSLVTLNPEMTQEVSVLSANFGADTPFGPVVVTSTSKSGGVKYHGEGYFDVRNDALNAIDWVTKHVATAAKPAVNGGAAYYYPGGNIGGPVPFTHDKVFFFGGIEILRQNTGNSAPLTAYIPSAAMLRGDFTDDDATNRLLCPTGFNSSTTSRWCNDLTGTVFADGGTPTIIPGHGGIVPAKYIDQNALALAKLWPDAETLTGAYFVNPVVTGSASAPGPNYLQNVTNNNNGYIFRVRVDYNPSETTKLFFSYQQGYSKQLANSNGAHIYYTPGNSIPFAGGGLSTTTYSKSVTGHLVHIFNPTMTNELIASYVYGSIPVGPANPAADYSSAIGYTAGGYYGSPSAFAPSYSGGTQSFPSYAQGDIFEPTGAYTVKKQVPAFTDNFTKVIGAHTVKVGAYTQNSDNLQGNMGTALNGNLSFAGGPAPNAFGSNGAAGYTGSYNGAVNFITGTLSGYNQSATSPLQDLAYQVTSFYGNDVWKVNRKLTVEYGVRVEHIGHWYDRQGNGVAVFLPSRVATDFAIGKPAPGYYWHGIDPGIPNSGQPNRLASVSPRFGVSYDLLGTGKTMVRGGIGQYRFATQYNDISAALTTAQSVQNFNTSSYGTQFANKNFQISQIGQLSTLVPNTVNKVGQISGSQTGLSSQDYGVPTVYSYNMTIDQQLPWKMLLDVAYVGNQAHQLFDDSETETAGFVTGYANQNKTPLGAFFLPDPVTGCTSPNPENLGGPGCPLNKSADYRPYGYAYGTSSAIRVDSVGYSNYNGLQVAVAKRTNRLTVNANFTWSKSLGTVNSNNPFDNRRNYGFASTDRPYVFNSSYIYRFGNVYHGSGMMSSIIGGAVNGWTISGISSWQAGSNTQPGLSYSYNVATLPGGKANNNNNGIGTGIGSNTYYGTDAGLSILPVLTCNPTAGLAYHQVFKACYAPPPVGQQGGKAFPYVRSAAYLENDLAIYKSFKVHGDQNVQFRFSAFNWLNHPLPNFSSSLQTTLYYTVDYNTKAITPTTQTSSTFGFLDYKAGAPTQRILELNAKYNF